LSTEVVPWFEEGVVKQHGGWWEVGTTINSKARWRLLEIALELMYKTGFGIEESIFCAKRFTIMHTEKQKFNILCTQRFSILCTKKNKKI
jgi:hypothetical protein